MQLYGPPKDTPFGTSDAEDTPVVQATPPTVAGAPAQLPTVPEENEGPTFETPLMFFTRLYGPEKAAQINANPLVARYLHSYATKMPLVGVTPGLLGTAGMPSVNPADVSVSEGIMDIPLGLGQAAQKLFPGTSWDQSKLLYNTFMDLRERRLKQLGASKGLREATRLSTAAALPVPGTLPAAIGMGAVESLVGSLTRPRGFDEKEDTYPSAVIGAVAGAGGHYTGKLLAGMVDMVRKGAPSIGARIQDMVDRLGGDAKEALKRELRNEYSQRQRQSHQLYQRYISEAGDRTVDISPVVDSIKLQLGSLAKNLDPSVSGAESFLSAILKRIQGAEKLGPLTHVQAYDLQKGLKAAARTARDRSLRGDPLAAYEGKIANDLAAQLDKVMDQSGGTTQTYWAFKQFRDKELAPFETVQDMAAPSFGLATVKKGRLVSPTPRKVVAEPETLDLTKVEEYIPGGKSAALEAAKQNFVKSMVSYRDKKEGARILSRAMSEFSPEVGVRPLLSVKGPGAARKIYEAMDAKTQEATRAALLSDVFEAATAPETGSVSAALRLLEERKDMTNQFFTTPAQKELLVGLRNTLYTSRKIVVRGGMGATLASMFGSPGAAAAVSTAAVLGVGFAKTREAAYKAVFNKLASARGQSFLRGMARYAPGSTAAERYLQNELPLLFPEAYREPANMKEALQ